jgi:D-alanyl-D-alanine carboxypeptidase
MIFAIGLAVFGRCGTIPPGLGTSIGNAYLMLSESHLKIHQDLGIPTDYGQENELPWYAQAEDLIEVGPNLVGRMQQLTPTAAASWQQMVEAASGDGVRLLMVSGYRSFEYQAQLIRNKLDSGQKIAEILTVNAAPGYSQHHTGGAVDIATPGSRPLTEEFEVSEAFAWLRDSGSRFGFSMTYPRSNPFGFVYEPWHWALRTAEIAA